MANATEEEVKKKEVAPTVIDKAGEEMAAKVVRFMAQVVISTVIAERVHGGVIQNSRVE